MRSSSVPPRKRKPTTSSTTSSTKEDDAPDNHSRNNAKDKPVVRGHRRLSEPIRKQAHIDIKSPNPNEITQEPSSSSAAVEPPSPDNVSDHSTELQFFSPELIGKSYNQGDNENNENTNKVQEAHKDELENEEEFHPTKRPNNMTALMMDEVLTVGAISSLTASEIAVGDDEDDDGNSILMLEEGEGLGHVPNNTIEWVKDHGENAAGMMMEEEDIDGKEEDERMIPILDSPSNSALARNEDQSLSFMAHSSPDSVSSHRAGGRNFSPLPDLPPSSLSSPPKRESEIKPRKHLTASKAAKDPERDRLLARIEYLTRALDEEKKINDELTDQITTKLLVNKEESTAANAIDGESGHRLYPLVANATGVLEKEQIMRETFSAQQIHQLAVEVREQETLLRGYQKEMTHQNLEIKQLRATLKQNEQESEQIRLEHHQEISLLRTRILDLESLSSAAAASASASNNNNRLYSNSNNSSAAVRAKEGEEAILRLQKELQALSLELEGERQMSLKSNAEHKEREKQLLLDLMNERQRRDRHAEKYDELLAERDLLAKQLEIVNNSSNSRLMPIVCDAETQTRTTEVEVVESDEARKGSEEAVNQPPNDTKQTQQQSSNSSSKHQKNLSSSSLSSASVKALKDEIQRIQISSVKTEKALSELNNKLKKDIIQLEKEKSGLATDCAKLTSANRELSQQLELLTNSTNQNGKAWVERLRKVDDKVSRLSRGILEEKLLNPLHLIMLTLRASVQKLQRRNVERKTQFLQGLENSKAELVSRHQRELESTILRLSQLERDKESLQIQLDQARQIAKELKGTSENTLRLELELERERQAAKSLRDEMTRMEQRYKEMHEETVKALVAKQKNTILPSKEKEEEESLVNNNQWNMINQLKGQIVDLSSQLVQLREAKSNLNNEAQHNPLYSQLIPEQIRSLQESNSQLINALSRLTLSSLNSNAVVHEASSHRQVEHQGDRHQVQALEKQINTMERHHEAELERRDGLIKKLQVELDAIMGELERRKEQLEDVISRHERVKYSSSNVDDDDDETESIRTANQSLVRFDENSVSY